jgi:alpha-tubulin suppressor-like RCC1 family protein
MSVSNPNKSGPWSVNDVYDKIKTAEWTPFDPNGSGTLWTWGDNATGALGIGLAPTGLCCALEPVNVPGNNWLCAQGSYAKFALKNDGTLWTWGNGGQGRLGTSSVIPRSSPTQVPGTAWCAVVDLPRALKNDGTLWSWGYNGAGYVGDGTTIPRSSPVQIPGTAWCAVGQNMALKTNGTLWAWGYGPNTGTNSIIPRSSPVQIPGSSWVQIGSELAALKSDGTFWRWGFNGIGELGNGTTIPRSSPTQVPGVWTFVESRGAIKADNSLWRWGYGATGDIGDGFFTPRSSPIQIPGLWFRSGGAPIGLKVDGTVWTWGTNVDGTLGAGISNTAVCVASPVFVGGGWSKIGRRGVLAIKVE